MTLRMIPLLIFVLLFSACTGLRPLPHMDSGAGDADESDAAIGDASTSSSEETPFDISLYPFDQALPMDPQIRKGVLDNGLTYYIRQNDEPANRGELWLAVNAGSTQEEDNELGLAHFLEHMMFNGTENFPGDGVIEFLESIGMEFGPDANAYTSSDETVYTIQVPTGDPAQVSTGLQILEEWAGKATLLPDAIDQERGIIVEEYRVRQESAQGRISEQSFKFYLEGSRYADRFPIGDMEIVRNVSPETMRNFYERWYRPELMAILAVGDFANLDQIEAEIIERFSDMINPDSAPERVAYEVPTHDETRFMVISDPEQTTTRIQLLRQIPNFEPQTPDEFRQVWTRRLAYSMLNHRLEEIARESDSPFLRASGGTGGYVRSLQVDFLSIGVEEEKIEAGLERVIMEAERANRFGFTASELERVQIELLQSYEQSYNERGNRDNGSYAQEYLRNFFTDESVPGIEVEYGLVQAIVPTITLEEVNQVTGEMVASDNRAVTLTAPEKDGLTLPTEEELAAIIEVAMAADLEPYEEQVVEGELVPTIPDPVEVVSTQIFEDVGVTEIELANGVRVLMKRTEFMDDEILFNGVSPGGSSLVAEEEFPEASTIANVVSQSGVGAFDQTELQKLLTGKTVSIVPYIREISEGMDGSSSVEDLETLFQLIYLYATEPRADEDAFEVFRTQLRAELVNREASPNAALRDALNQALYGDTLRRNTLPVEEVDGLELERGFEIYQERFADMSDFTFSFTGSFDEAELTRLAQIYLGNLPSTNREETWEKVINDPPTEVVQETIFKGEGEQSIVYLVFPTPYEFSPEGESEHSALQYVLDNQMRKIIREDLGAAYSSGSFAFINEIPSPYSFVYLYVVTDPERVKEIIDVSFEIIDDVQTNGISEEEMESAKAIDLAADEENLESNGYWLSKLKDYAIYGNRDLSDTLTTPERVNDLTAEGIQSVAQEVISSDRFIQIVLYPEGFEVAE